MTEAPKDRSAPSDDVELRAPLPISVMLIVPDADAATAWYKTALGATELWNLGGVVGMSRLDAAPCQCSSVRTR